MNASILLLDCSKELHKRLKRQGFDVASGSVSFLGDEGPIPGPIYEYDVIIYNPPKKVESRPPPDTGQESSGTSPLDEMLKRAYEEELRKLEHLKLYGDQTSREFGPLAVHVEQRGAKVLIFLNRIFDDIRLLNAAYAWVPSMPEIVPTRDFKPLSSLSFIELYARKGNKTAAIKEITELAPVLTTDDLKRPVRQKIVFNDMFKQQAVGLYFNKQLDCLGFSLKVGGGRIIALPEYEDNEHVISTFLTRVLPRIQGERVRKDIIDDFTSPLEQTAKSQIHDIESKRAALDKRLEETMVNFADAARRKRQIIESDETAARITAYYGTATQQEDVALFYLYKIIDALENRFGGATAAHKKLGTEKEWKLIGMTANASYGDIRHAPKPGEKLKEWTEDEIENCFSAAVKIIEAYFATLF